MCRASVSATTKAMHASEKGKRRKDIERYIERERENEAKKETNKMKSTHIDMSRYRDRGERYINT